MLTLTITDIELVMQILRQLPPSYHNIVDVITNTKPYLSFLEAKNMLLLHESREVSTEFIPKTFMTQNFALFSLGMSIGTGLNRNRPGTELGGEYELNWAAGSTDFGSTIRISARPIGSIRFRFPNPNVHR